MNEKIARMVKELQRRGATIGINESSPDWLTEQFLEEVLACPRCIAESKNTLGPRIDDILSGTIPKRFSGQ
jgi:hypothetical protein